MTTQQAAGSPEHAPQTEKPVFYSKPEALNATRHERLRLFPRPGFGFAAKAHAIPVMAQEMPMAMRSYPLVFVGEFHMPVAITGLRRDQNLFVDAQGNWAEPHYVPAYVRRYPFILAGEDAGERLTLCIERDSDRVTETEEEGAKLLFEDGNPSEVTKGALTFCEQYQSMHNATRATISAINGHDLFVDRQSRITLSNGEQLSLTDFQVIDEAKLNALEDNSFLSLRQAGALPLIYCHLASMNSWNALLSQEKTRLPVD